MIPAPQGIVATYTPEAPGATTRRLVVVFDNGGNAMVLPDWGYTLLRADDFPGFRQFVREADVKDAAAPQPF